MISQENISSIPHFNYDERFLKSGIEVSPLTMPLSQRLYSFPSLNKETFYGLPGLLADSLPDRYGTKLIERYLSEQGRSLSSLTAIERLCYVGNRGMGALEFIPAKGYANTPDESINIDALVKLASDILTEKENFHITTTKDTMNQIIKIGTSAGGARAKAIVAWNEETNDIRSGQIALGSGYNYWLIKFDGVENNKDKGDKADEPGYTRIEYAYYLMAKDAGINMSECRLFEESDRYHFMTKRFDRTPDTGKKIHMQTLGALAHFDYNMPGVHSYEQVAAIIYQLGMGQVEIEQLFRRMAFNIIARNQDDHVKNISFLMDPRGKWSLAPAYDITYTYDATNYWLSRHQMSMNGKLEHFTLEDFYKCGQGMNIRKSRIDKILTEVKLAISNWPVYAEKAKVHDSITHEIKKQHLNI